MVRSINDYKKNKEYAHGVVNIVTTRYGIESKMFDPMNKFRIGIEEVQDELEENIEGGEDISEAPMTEEEITVDTTMTDDGYGEDTGEGNLDGDGSKGIGDLSNDGKFGEYSTPSEKWDETEFDDLKSRADSVNMMKIIGNYTNEYTKGFEDVYKRNSEIIDFTGDFKSSKMNIEFVQPAMSLLTQVFKDSQLVKYLEKLIEIMQEKRKMVAITGKPDNPFLYEGFQLILFESLRTCLALVPMSIKQNAGIEEVITKMNLNVPKCLTQMIADIIEISPILATKIYFVEPQVSEVTKTSNEIYNTPYAELDVFNEETKLGKTPAGESIMNLVEIKNNSALLEFSALNKMLTIIVGLVKDLDLYEVCREALSQVMKLVSVNSEEVEGFLEEVLTYVKEKVIMPQIQRMADMSAEESRKMTEDPDMELADNSSANVSTNTTVGSDMPEQTEMTIEVTDTEEEPQDIDEF